MRREFNFQVEDEWRRHWAGCQAEEGPIGPCATLRRRMTQFDSSTQMIRFHSPAQAIWKAWLPASRRTSVAWTGMVALTLQLLTRWTFLLAKKKFIGQVFYWPGFLIGQVNLIDWNINFLLFFHPEWAWLLRILTSCFSHPGRGAEILANYFCQSTAGQKSAGWMKKYNSSNVVSSMFRWNKQ